SRFGATVILATDAADALAKVDAEAPHAIVADIAMPGEDGLQMLERLRAQPAEKGGATPAVALTAYASPRDRAGTLRAGFQAHLSKPALPTELARVLARICGHPSVGTTTDADRP